MSAPDDAQPHLQQEEYSGITEALHDAHHVLLDLQALAEGRTVVAVSEFDFLARRARALVRACLEAE